MVDLPHLLGKNSIRTIRKAYNLVIKNWHRERKPSKSKNEVGEEPCHSRNFDEGCQEFGKDKKERRRMSGVNCFGQREARRGDEPASPRGFFRQRTVDDAFSSVPSFSRSASRRSRTPTPSSLFRSVTKKNADSVPSPASNGRRGTEATPSPPSMMKCGSRRSSTPIMFSNSSGMLKPPAIEKELECTLEELCYGCTKKIKNTRDIITITGQKVQEEEFLTIRVKPGWKKGTKITFEGMGNERPGAYPADVTFIIAEKRHQVFRREGDDLELAVEIPLLKALTGCTISVPLLGGGAKSIKVEDIIYPGYEKIIEGQGMPISKEQGKRGNLKMTFLVEFPKELTEEQRQEIVDILGDCS